MNKLPNIKTISIFCLTIIIYSCTTPEPIEKSIQIRGSTMGTSYNVVIPNPQSSHDKLTLSTAITSILNKITNEMSTYEPNSSISQFNQNTSTDWVEMPKGIIKLVEQAQNISEKTQGAYDITIGPIVNLWGFGPTAQTDTIPERFVIQEVLKRVGYQKLSHKIDPPQLKKSHKLLTIDLSSIAKGYGVDLIGEHLETQGIKDYLVEIGGELRTRGVSARNDAWRIGIETPSTQSQVQQALRLNTSHIATSGDYRNYFEKNGQRYSHTINAITGQTIKHKLASVTVAHSSTLEADAWSTALMVLGEENGFNLANKEGIAAFFIYHKDGQFVTEYTKLFKQYLEPINKSE